MICPKCGAENENGALSCKNCNAAIADVIRENKNESGLQPENFLNSATTDIPQSRTKKSSLAKKLIFAAISLFVALSVILAGFVIFNRGSSETDSSKNEEMPKKTEQIDSFDASWRFFPVGATEEVVFFAKASSKPMLFKTDEALGEMHDDGKDGDDEADDGIFSIQITVKAEEEKEEEYYAGFEKQQTDPIILRYYDRPTNEEENLFKSSVKEIEELDDRFENDKGFVNESDAKEILGLIESYIDELKKKDIVTEFTNNDGESFSVLFSSGLTYLYIPNIEGFAAGGNANQLNILTYEPHRYEFYNSVLDDAALDITKKFSDIKIYNRLDDDLVTTQSIKTEFKSDRLIFWFGHGAYDYIGHSSVIITGESFISLDSNPLDFVTGRLLISNDWKIAFSAGFVDKYIGNINNSLIYLNCCESCKDDTLANAFLKKGAKTVIGNNKTIRATYAHNIQVSTIDHMCEKNETDRYNTVQEALNLSKQEFGEDDSGYGGKGARTIIYGNKNYSFSEYENAVENENAVANEDDETANVNTENSISLTDLISIQEKPKTTDLLEDNYGNTYTNAITNKHNAGPPGPVKYEYVLDSKYSNLIGTLYIPKGETSGYTSTFTVKGDGDILYLSPAINKISQPININVDISGVNDLIIEWSNNSRSNVISDLQCCLAEAKFLIGNKSQGKISNISGRPIALTDLVSVFSEVKTSHDQVDNKGNSYSFAISNHEDMFHAEIPIYQYNLDSKYRKFECMLYVPKITKFTGNVFMKIIADGKEIYVSPQMSVTSDPVKVSVDLSRCKELQITFSDCWYLSNVSEKYLCLGNPLLYK